MENKLKIKKPRLKSAINPLTKYFATLIIQSFYRRYVHCDRDQNGLPIDPISLEGVEKEKQIRIIYKTIQTSYKRTVVVGRVQIFDIEWLWKSILNTNKHVPINPLTNTRFTRVQFEKILKYAVTAGFLNEKSVNRISARYERGLASISYSSVYEATEWNLLKTDLEKVRLRLVDFLLQRRWNDFIELLHSQSGRIEQDLFQINIMIDNKTKRFEYLKKFNLVQLCCAVGAYEPLVILLEYGAMLSMLIRSYVYPIHIALREANTHLLEPLLLYGGSEQIEYESCLGTTLELAENLLEKDPLIYQKLFSTV